MDREFNARLAHLLRNPLNALSLHLQIARRRLRTLDGEHAAALESTLDIAQHELQRICNVLNVLARDQRTTAAFPDIDSDEKGGRE